MASCFNDNEIYIKMIEQITKKKGCEWLGSDNLKTGDTMFRTKIGGHEIELEKHKAQNFFDLKIDGEPMCANNETDPEHYDEPDILEDLWEFITGTQEFAKKRNAFLKKREKLHNDLFNVLRGL